MGITNLVNIYKFQFQVANQLANLSLLLESCVR